MFYALSVSACNPLADGGASPLAGGVVPTLERVAIPIEHTFANSANNNSLPALVRITYRHRAKLGGLWWGVVRRFATLPKVLAVTQVTVQNTPPFESL